MQEIVKVFNKDDKYQHLLEEIASAVQAKRDERKLSLIEENYIIGQMMIDFVEKNKYRATEVVREVAADLGQSETNVWNVYRIVKEQPDVNKFFISYRSWTEGKQQLLGTGTPTRDIQKIAQNLIKRYGIEDARKVAQHVLDTP